MGEKLERVFMSMIKMENVYINGIGRTKFGALNRTLPELAYDAMYNAIKDSDLSINDIGAIVVANFLGGPGQGQLHINSLIASLLPGINIPIFRVETACASGGIAVQQGALLLENYENVLVLGVEKLNDSSTLKITKNLAMAGDDLADQKEGVIFPAQYAMIASQYIKKYGASREDLSLVSLKNHKTALKNPLAHFYHKNVELEMINKSPDVCSPFNLFDCSPISDGAAALVLSKKYRSKRDIKILASESATDTISLSHRKDITSFKAAKIAAKKAYEKANVLPEDIDIAQVHDCFTIAEILALEDLGFCEEGKAISAYRENSFPLNGKLHINTDGGLIGDGHPVGATGVAQIYEVVEQLRGEADKRQVKDAKIGLTHNIGGAGGTCVVHILGEK